MQNKTIAPASLFLGLMGADSCCEATEALKSTLITGYEQAIEGGLSPMNALATVLGWVAEEFGRMNDEARAPSSSSQLRRLPGRTLQGWLKSRTAMPRTLSRSRLNDTAAFGDSDPKNLFMTLKPKN